MRKLEFSLGKKHPATITKTGNCTFKEFAAGLLKAVPVTKDKAAAGWVCGAVFRPEYRHSENFRERNFLSLDYDHIGPEDTEKVLAMARSCGAFLAYTTWSHTPDHPRMRVWAPLSRPATEAEYQAVARKVASRAGIELAARESFTATQFMYRPCAQKGIEFAHWSDTEGPPLDIDKVLGEYSDWTDRGQWPRRDDEEVVLHGAAESPLDKPGIVGDFCRAFTITDAIERFGLPYTPGTEGRWTYDLGSVANGAVSYDDDTKLHSHHDTDPARGQHNAFDLVRLHRFGALDTFDADLPIAERESHRAMAALAMEQPELAGKYGSPFTDLDAVGPEQPAMAPRNREGGREQCAAESSDGPTGGPPPASLPARIAKGTSRTSDLENARRIQKAYGHKIISLGGAFYVWTGTHWSKSEQTVKGIITTLSQLVEDEVTAMVARKESEDAIKALRKWASTCCNHAALQNCEGLLRNLLGFKGEAMNGDRALLTTLTGTVDLRTGAERPHRPDDFITACAPTNYDPAATAPRFQLFLREIFDNDDALVAFAQRWFGYCITGEVVENAIVFHVGEGGNGKSLLMKVLQYVLGPDYACKGARTLLSKGGTGASPEMADLLGKRMVTLSETNREEEFNEGVLKELTGGDRIKARNLYEGYFEFDPTHKLQVFTNYEPRIIGQDRGIWRRIFLLPYEVRFGRAEDIAAGLAAKLQDERLIETLMREREGILAWLVAGAKQWYAKGLQPPPTVLRRTERFRVSQDLVGQFLRERTVRDPEAFVPYTHGPESIYAAYKGWATEMGYYKQGRNRFLNEVRRAAPYAVEGKKSGSLGFMGLRLASEPLPAEVH